MSQIDRRFLLGGIAGVAGAAAVARIAQGGPLNPPTGAVGSTGRTLDEIYSAVNDAADLRTVIMSNSSGLLISTSGSYVLGEDFVVSGNSGGLTINAPDVTLDLNGFTVKNTTVTGTTAGITVNGAGQRAVIRNGRVVGFANGITCAAQYSLIEDVSVSASRVVGISGNVSHFTLRRCIVQAIGQGTSASETVDSRGIAIFGDFVTVQDCQVFQVSTNTTGRLATGIYQFGSTGVHVVGNTVTACTNGIRLNVSPSVVARNNTVTNCPIPWTNGITGNAGGNYPAP